MSHAETPKTGARNAEQPAPLAESTPTSARPSAPRKITREEALAKLADDSCGCGLCDLIATIATIKTGLDDGESCEHRWFEVSRWGNPQRRWLRCSECGEAIEEAP